MCCCLCRTQTFVTLPTPCFATCVSQSGVGSDVTFEVEGDAMEAHKIILQVGEGRCSMSGWAVTLACAGALGAGEQRRAAACRH